LSSGVEWLMKMVRFNLLLGSMLLAPYTLCVKSQNLGYWKSIGISIQEN
jgi:hypothetical protein